MGCQSATRVCVMDRVLQSHKCFMLIFIFSSVGLRFPASDNCSMNYTKGSEPKAEFFCGREKFTKLYLKMLYFSQLLLPTVFMYLLTAVDNVKII